MDERLNIDADPEDTLRAMLADSQADAEAQAE